MSYFGFLALFILPPLLALTALAWRDERRGPALPVDLSNHRWPRVLLAHVLVAVVYTTPWDNYLVATGVWYYDPALVSGLILGWVPIEEYVFFVLETLMAGLWLVAALRRLPASPHLGRAPLGLTPNASLPHPVPGGNDFKGPGRRGPKVLNATLAALLALPWLWSLASLAGAGDPSQTYLALLLVWALPPIMLQVGLGADILWARRRALLATLLPLTLYLAVVDAVAIGAGTWTIDPRQSLNVLILGRLPVEELVFFFLTVTLVSFGMTLVLSTAAQARLQPWFDRLARR